MRSLIVSAYACEPLKGSEPAVGWNWVLQLARRNRVHVITRANNQEVIEAHLPQDISENLVWHYYDTPAFIKRLKKRDKGLYFYNFCWQIGIVNVARRIAQKEHIDYAIHLTFGSIWMPTFLPFLNIPFIWGPMGGGECVPISFLKVMPWKQRIVQYYRYFLNATTLVNPFIVQPAHRAKAILVRTPNTQRIIPCFYQNKTHVLLETAMDHKIFERQKFNYEADVVKLVISARLISIKNIPTAIRALSYIKTNKRWQLTIIGSGPDLGIINKEIKHQGYNNVKIIPSMPREEALNLIQESDIFVFPSLKEGGTWALMEAMAIGLPVVCANWAGMAVETNEETAIRLYVSEPKQMEIDMGAALTRLINDSDLRKKIGSAARERIRTLFSWEAKGDFMENLFDKLDTKA